MKKMWILFHEYINDPLLQIKLPKVYEDKINFINHLLGKCGVTSIKKAENKKMQKNKLNKYYYILWNTTHICEGVF